MIAKFVVFCQEKVQELTGSATDYLASSYIVPEEMMAMKARDDPRAEMALHYELPTTWIIDENPESPIVGIYFPEAIHQSLSSGQGVTVNDSHAILEEVSHFCYIHSYIRKYRESPHYINMELIGSLDNYFIINDQVSIGQSDVVDMEKVKMICFNGAFRDSLDLDHIIGHSLALSFFQKCEGLDQSERNAQYREFYQLSNHEQVKLLLPLAKKDLDLRTMRIQIDRYLVQTYGRHILSDS